MADKSYSTDALVLRKTRLGEADLIVRMMDEEGRLLEAVAKGARRPQGSLSGRLELFNRVSMHCARGKNLDIVKEARLVRAGKRLATSPEYGAAAACIAELASRTIQPDLEVPRYFQLTDAAFAAIESAEPALLPALVAAYVFKATSMMGMRPSFRACVMCGRELEPDTQARISFADGGNVCDECAATTETYPVPANLLLWADSALMSTFDDISAWDASDVAAGDLLHLADMWALEHAEVRMKSISALAAYSSML